MHTCANALHIQRLICCLRRATWRIRLIWLQVTVSCADALCYATPEGFIAMLRCAARCVCHAILEALRQT
jgi:hypothetical protein